MAEDSKASDEDPRRAMARDAMTGRQVLAIAICVLLNALDGFDVLSISFAAPGIAREWGITPAALGVVLSMEPIGMAFGSVLLGQFTDRVGRRPTVIGCLLIMASGMLGSALVSSVEMLVASRLFTGFGIGGMLAVTNALVAEYANDRWRGAAVAVMAAGYPLGAITGGAIASSLLETGGWRDVFMLGAVMAAAMLPLSIALLPEPVSALLQRRRDDTLARVNKTLRALGKRPATVLPPPGPRVAKARLGSLFAAGVAPVTILLTTSYFFHILTFYFMLKWIPKIVVEMGFTPSEAGSVLVWANVGGLAGSLLFAALSLRFPLRGLVVAFMIVSCAMVAVFGIAPADLAALSTAAALAVFFGNAAVVGLYALIATRFATAIRGGGTGFVIGVGRGGGILGPVIGGLLFQAGVNLPVVAIIMGGSSLLAATVLLMLPRPAREDDGAVGPNPAKGAFA